MKELVSSYLLLSAGEATYFSWLSKFIWVKRRDLHREWGAGVMSNGGWKRGARGKEQGEERMGEGRSGFRDCFVSDLRTFSRPQSF